MQFILQSSNARIRYMYVFLLKYFLIRRIEFNMGLNPLKTINSLFFRNRFNIFYSLDKCSKVDF